MVCGTAYEGWCGAARPIPPGQPVEISHKLLDNPVQLWLDNDMSNTDRLNKIINRAENNHPITNAAGEPVRKASGIVDGHKVEVRVNGFSGPGPMNFRIESMDMEVTTCTTVSEALAAI